tara:strand:- start:1310 stop:1654 length:345 start_codon:yes stop_codon:yes gene_type:complete
MKKVEMVRKIESWLKKNRLTSCVRIYFNNKCFCWYDSSKNKKIIEDIKGSDYFDYANDETISMSFEGPLYEVLNYACDSKRYETLEDEFINLIKSYGYYYELGNAWNLSMYEIG